VLTNQSQIHTFIFPRTPFFSFFPIIILLEREKNGMCGGTASEAAIGHGGRGHVMMNHRTPRKREEEASSSSSNSLSQFLWLLPNGERRRRPSGWWTSAGIPSSSSVSKGNE